MIFRSSLVELFTEELLIFSWNEIKKSELFHSCLSNNANILASSISSNWLRKMAFLIKKGKFFVKKDKAVINCYGFRKQKYTLFFKNLIIENAFIRIMEPRFLFSTPYRSLNSTNCLRFSL